MRLCFDIDNTLLEGSTYKSSKPKAGAVDYLQELKKDGHTIILYTARKMHTHQGNLGAVLKDVALLTLNQLEEFGFVYDEIYFGKPSADVYIDDKALLAINFNDMKDNLNELLNK